VFDPVQPVTAVETANFGAIHAGFSEKRVRFDEDAICFVQ
jgi:hypothetical protein